MDIQAMNDWTDLNNYNQAWAPTNDPRVIAVIRFDEEASFQSCLDGDAILPTFMVDRGRVDHIGGYDEDESLAQEIVDAYDRFLYAAGYRYDGLSGGVMVRAQAMLERWAWIFHGTTLNRGHYGYNSAYDVLILNTPAYREHIEAEDTTREKAQEWVDSMTDEIADIADNYVYGIGYAVNEARVLDDEPIDIEDGSWEETIEVWGFVGEDYAKQEAGAFTAGAPELPEMLSVA